MLITWFGNSCCSSIRCKCLIKCMSRMRWDNEDLSTTEQKTSSPRKSGSSCWPSVCPTVRMSSSGSINGPWFRGRNLGFAHRWVLRWYLKCAGHTNVRSQPSTVHLSFFSTWGRGPESLGCPSPEPRWTFSPVKESHICNPGKDPAQVLRIK